MEKYCTQLICLVTLVVNKQLTSREHPCLNRTYHASQVSVVTLREGPVPRSWIISMFMKSNMHIFEQCSQWQKEQEELLGTNTICKTT